MDDRIDRRRVLAGLGALGTGSLAGCTSGGGSGDDGDGGGDGNSDGEMSESGTDSEQETDSSDGDGQAETVTIGSPQGLTGRYSSVAQPVADAVRLAEQEINDAGGIGDREVNISIEDVGWTVEEARPVVDKMLNVDQVPLILGLTSGILEPVWDDIQSAETPVISGYPGSTFLDERGGDNGTPQDLADDGWAWRTIASFTIRLLGMARYLRAERNASTLAIFTGSEPGDQSQAGAMRRAWQGLGGQVVTEVTYRTDQSNFRTPLTKLYENDFDAVYFSTPEADLAKIGQQWSELGYNERDAIVVVTNGAISEDIFQPYFEGVLQASSQPAGPAKDIFEERFGEFSDHEPNVWTYANWDAAVVGALAMERALQRDGEITRATVQRNIGPVARDGGTTVTSFEEGKAALQNGNEVDYDGAASAVEFDDFGNVSAAVNIQQFGDTASTSVVQTIPLETLTELLPQISE
jgi:branched-chain amino acid transport system substrate-binding protein